MSLIRVKSKFVCLLCVFLSCKNSTPSKNVRDYIEDKKVRDEFYNCSKKIVDEDSFTDFKEKLASYLDANEWDKESLQDEINDFKKWLKEAAPHNDNNERPSVESLDSSVFSQLDSTLYNYLCKNTEGKDKVQLFYRDFLSYIDDDGTLSTINSNVEEKMDEFDNEEDLLFGNPRTRMAIEKKEPVSKQKINEEIKDEKKDDQVSSSLVLGNCIVNDSSFLTDIEKHEIITAYAIYVNKYMCDYVRGTIGVDLLEYIHIITKQNITEEVLDEITKKIKVAYCDKHDFEIAYNHANMPVITDILSLTDEEKEQILNLYFKYFELNLKISVPGYISSQIDKNISMELLKPIVCEFFCKTTDEVKSQVAEELSIDALNFSTRHLEIIYEHICTDLRNVYGLHDGETISLPINLYLWLINKKVKVPDMMVSMAKEIVKKYSKLSTLSSKTLKYILRKAILFNKDRFLPYLAYAVQYAIKDVCMPRSYAHDASVKINAYPRNYQKELMHEDFKKAMYDLFKRLSLREIRSLFLKTKRSFLHVKRDSKNLGINRIKTNVFSRLFNGRIICFGYDPEEMIISRMHPSIKNAYLIVDKILYFFPFNVLDKLEMEERLELFKCGYFRKYIPKYVFMFPTDVLKMIFKYADTERLIGRNV